MSAIHVLDRFRLELCPALAIEILDRSSRPSYGSKNVGGWKSHEDLLEWGTPTTKAFAAALAMQVDTELGCAQRWKIIAWAMVNRAGSHHPRHIHSGKRVGIYYVTPGDPPVPTVFEITQRVPQKQIPGRPRPDPFVERAIQPDPARLVTFAPNTWHRVPVYRGSEPRITIAFEVRPC